LGLLLLLLLLSTSGDGYKDCGGGGDRVQQAKVSKLLEGEPAPGGDGDKEADDADDADDGDGNDGDIGAMLTGDNLASSSSDW
jgi:hypothetical protein